MVNIKLAGNETEQALFFNEETETPETSIAVGGEKRRNTLEE